MTQIMHNGFFRLLQSYISSESSEDLQMKSKTALKKILQKCVYLPSLEPLLHDAPSNILKHVVAQYSKVKPSRKFPLTLNRLTLTPASLTLITASSYPHPRNALKSFLGSAK